MTTTPPDHPSTDLMHEVVPLDLAQGTGEWETAQVRQAWAWLDERTPAADTLVPTPRRASAS